MEQHVQYDFKKLQKCDHNLFLFLGVKRTLHDSLKSKSKMVRQILPSTVKIYAAFHTAYDRYSGNNRYSGIKSPDRFFHYSGRCLYLSRDL